MSCLSLKFRTSDDLTIIYIQSNQMYTSKLHNRIERNRMEKHIKCLQPLEMEGNEVAFDVSLFLSFNTLLPLRCGNVPFASCYLIDIWQLCKIEHIQHMHTNREKLIHNKRIF